MRLTDGHLVRNLHGAVKRRRPSGDPPFVSNNLLGNINFSGWKLSTPTPEEMAAAGFYMTGNEDETRSPFNMKVIAGWEEGDSAQKEVIS